MELNQALNWRYATKRMNGEKVPQTAIDNIINAIRLAPTSLGLQAFKAYVIESEELRKKIHEKACQQPQVIEGSHIIVFAARKDLLDSEVDDYMQNIATVRGVDVSTLADFKGMILGSREQTKANYFQWAARQTYIALGFALVAAAEQGVDSTPMEGFDATELDKVLNLSEKGLSSTLVMAIGHRNPETDYLAKAKKVRKPMDELIVRL